MDDFPALFQHGFLVFPHRHMGGMEGGDICSLAHWIAEKAQRHAGFEVLLLDFRLDGGIPLYPGHGDQVHIIGSQFKQFRDQALDEDDGFLGIDAHSQIIQGHLEHVLPDFFRIFRIVRQRLGIGDHEIQFIELPAVLEQDPFLERTHKMAYMEMSRGAVPGQNDF